MTAIVPPRRFLFDVTGLLSWYAYARHPSGIPRVSERLVNAAPLRDNPNVEFVTRVLGDHRLYRVDRSLLMGLSLPSDRARTIARLRRLFSRALMKGSPRMLLRDLRHYHLLYLYFGLIRQDWLVESYFARGLPRRAVPLEAIPLPGPADVLFHPGDLFWQRRCAFDLVHLRATTGVRLVEFVHDLFALDHPEWADDQVIRLASTALATVSPHVDRWVTNSEFVKRQLANYLAGAGLPVRPTRALPMGWDSFDAAVEVDPTADRGTLGRLGLSARPFILFVGTIEPRKNLGLLLDVFEEMRAALGERMPALVLVGGGGWKSEAIRERLRRTAGVHWFRAINDAELTVLYRHAQFTVAPSFSEGWGLPVQESLAMGVPCIASSGGAMPEAAHGVAELFDPCDRAGLRAAMERWVTDEAALAAARARIQEALPPASRPTWDVAAECLLSHAFDDQPG